MKIIGIDLAGMEKNDTGVCVLEDRDTKIKLVHKDSEIVALIEAEKPGLVCIDGPTTLPVQLARRCDAELAAQGALPPLVGGMRYLTMRATRLRERLEADGFKVIEVCNAATAKLLGYWDPEPTRRQKALLKMGLTGDVGRRVLSKDEVDAVTAALTGALHVQEKTAEVGDEEGKIIIPKV